MPVSKERRWPIAACALFLGVISAIAQVLLIRELMTAFSGHELVFVVVLAAWLVGIAIGSVCCRWQGLRLAVGLLASSIFLIPLTIVGARLLKPALGIPLGSVADMGVVAAGASVLLLPLTVVLGAVFAVLARQAAGKDIYAYEALGFVVGGVLMTFVFIVPLPRAIAVWSEQTAWPGYHLIAAEQTRYGSLVVVERGGQKSFFENGRLLFTAGDAASAEEVHAGLLTHPAPRTVFLMGGGFSQAGQEALKHPLQHLDYAELDPAVVRIERRYAGLKEDPRLNVMTGDPRAVLERSGRLYDVIVMDEGDPVSLLAGRFFTREFFDQAHARLAPGGILAVTINSSENDVNAQGQAYAGSVMATLASVFASVVAVPGERMTFIASDAAYEVTPGLWVRQLEQRGIRTVFMRDYYLNDRMSPARMAEARDWLFRRAARREVSSDVSPLTSLRALVFATTRTGTGFSKLMEVLERGQQAVWLLIPALFWGGAVARKRFLPVAGAAAAGFTQMVFQVASILLMQEVFGYAYAAVGIMTAGFMLGILLGVRFLRCFRPQDGAWLQVLLAMLFMTVLLHWPLGIWVFPVMAGMAGGVQFAVYTTMAGDRHSARIYAADVAGAACGAVCAGLFLLPLWGMAMTMLFVAAINGVMVLLTVQPKSVSADL